MESKIKEPFRYNIVLILIIAVLSLIKFHTIPFLLFVLISSLLFFSKKALRFAIYFSLVATSSITILIVLSLFAETVMFFKAVPPLDFLFGTVWQPNLTISNGQLTKLFGILPLLFGTLMISAMATIIAAPIGMCSAIFLTYFTSIKQRSIIKPLIEVMAGIPTVVYGYFSLNFVSPLVRSIGHFFKLNISTESALCAGFIIGIMIIPLITSLVDDILHSIPKSLYYGAAALGSTQTEIILNVMLPYSFPGILSTVLLAFSRALGETMIVLMLAGVAANFTFNPLQSITTITVQIITILTGDQTFNNKESLSAYALGLTLFILTWVLNAIAIGIAGKYRR